MKFFRQQMFIALLLCTTFASQAAPQCDASINYGVIIENERVRFVDKGKTFIQINQNKQLFVEGVEIALSPEQQRTLFEYSKGLKQQVPGIVSIAINAVDLSLDAVSKIIGGLTGENSQAQQRIQETFGELKINMQKRFNHSEGSYYLAAQSFNEFDELLEDQFKEEIKEIVSKSVGSILVAVGQAMKSENSFEQQAEDLGQRMEDVGNELSIDLSDKATDFKVKIAEFCHSLHQLEHIETRLSEEIPELQDFNLISVQLHGTAEEAL